MSDYLSQLEGRLTGAAYADPSIDPWNGGKFDPAKRARGLDWPTNAETMIGTARMRNLRELCEYVIKEGVPGDFIECGVWRGGACIYMRAILDFHKDPDRRVFVADSFAGLPKPDARYPDDAGDEHHAQQALSVSRAEVEANFLKYGLLDDRVVFLEGWFEDTLPKASIDKLAVLRLDGDMYCSTIQALEALYDKVPVGGAVIIDDYHSVPGARKAVNEFRAKRGITAPMVMIDECGVWWRVEAKRVAAAALFIPSAKDMAAALSLSHRRAPANPVFADRLDRAKSRNVMVATPVARDPTIQYLVSLLKTFAAFTDLGIKHRAEFITGSSNLPRARNGLVARFLASECTDLLMIDDDMGWNANSAVRLLASDKPFIAAAGRKKNQRPNSDPAAWCAQWLREQESVDHDDMGAVKVARVGGAFAKIERGVFEKLIAAHPEWKHLGHEEMTAEQHACYHQFFRFDTESNQEIGEDYLFCDRWRAIGGEVWVDPSIELTHMGPMPYTGRLLEILHPVHAKIAA